MLNSIAGSSSDTFMLPSSEGCNLASPLGAAAKWQLGYIPVRSEYLLGVQSGAGVCALPKLMPAAPSALI